MKWTSRLQDKEWSRTILVCIWILPLLFAFIELIDTPIHWLQLKNNTFSTVVLKSSLYLFLQKVNKGWNSYRNILLVTESQVLSCISDDKTIQILDMIKEGQFPSIARIELTRKQYYSRLHKLVICGLIAKSNGKFQLTSFGKVVFDWHLVLLHAISEEYWKLKALDVLDSSGIPSSERSKIMDALVKNEKLKRFIKV